MTMKPRYRPPLNKRYFHTRPAKDRRDMQSLKSKINAINRDIWKKQLEQKKRDRNWRI
jgi:hypothetical protein